MLLIFFSYLDFYKSGIFSPMQDPAVLDGRFKRFPILEPSDLQEVLDTSTGVSVL